MVSRNSPDQSEQRCNPWGWDIGKISVTWKEWQCRIITQSWMLRDDVQVSKNHLFNVVKLLLQVTPLSADKIDTLGINQVHKVDAQPLYSTLSDKLARQDVELEVPE